MVFAGPRFPWLTGAIASLLAAITSGCGPKLYYAPVTGFAMESRPAAQARSGERPPGFPSAPVYLTLKEAVGYALAGNRELQVTAFDPRKAEKDRDAAASAYDPSAFSGGQMSRVDRPIQSLLDTGSPTDTRLLEERWTVQLGMRKPLITGGTLSAYQQVDQLESNSEYTVPNPQYSSALTVQLNQPLLKGGFGYESRAAIQIADIGIGITNDQFQAKVLETIAEVTRSYWQIAYERELIRVARDSLERAVEVHRRESARQREGISRGLDVDRALAAVESRKSDVQRAESRLTNATRRLWFLLNSPELPPLSPALDIVPRESLDFEIVEIDRRQALETALSRRTDLKAAEKEARISRLRKDVAWYTMLPTLDAKGSYSWNSLERHFDQSAGHAYDSDHNSWFAGLELEWPFGGPAGPNFEKAALEEEQARTRVTLLREKIRDDVELALSDLELAIKDIQSSRETKQAIERIARSENARFELMEIGSDDLLSVQERLAAAERELARALTAFQISRMNLYLAQGVLLDHFEIQAVAHSAGSPNG